MTRYFSAFLLLLSSICLAASDNEPTASADETPNFLLIVVDDMAMADLGSFGGEIDTPNLDRLAEGGVRLTNFHTSPVCSATRAMLLTGVDNHIAGLGNMAEEMAPNQVGKPGHEGELNDRVVTIASILQQDGYDTSISGKWHLGMSDTASPRAKGFDRSFTLLAGGASHYGDMSPAYHPDPDGKAPYRSDGEMLTALPENFQYSSQFYAENLISYLAESNSENSPFFAYLSFTAPHWPLQAPEDTIAEYKGRFDAGFDAVREARLERQKVLGIVGSDVVGNERPPSGRSWNGLNGEERRIEVRAMEIYAAMIDEIDQNVGLVLDHLRKSGQIDNTVIIFISDNGAEGHDIDETWPADQFPEIRKSIDERHDFSFENMGKLDSYVFYGPNWARAGAPAFRLHKGFPTEGGTRVAAFMNYKSFAGGEISDRFFTVKDIAPTILELAGVAHPEPSFDGREVAPMTGFSMVSALTDPEQLAADEDRVEAGEILGKYMVRQGQWKIVHMPSPAGTGNWQLYNLEDDLAETRDLAEQRPEKLRELVAEWDRYAAENGVILPDQVSGY